MNKTYDAIIIGAGVIGTASAFEMAKKGWKTLSIDRNGEAGHGSTSASCAIIRVHYSTLEGTAFAYEGYHYWRDWARYLEFSDERGLAQYYNCGCCVLQTKANDNLDSHTKHCDEIGIPYERWEANDIRQRIRDIDMRQFSPAKRLNDTDFGKSTGKELTGGIFFPTAGYVSDPALSSHNLQRAAENKGAEFLFNRSVVEILQSDGRVSGVKLADGEVISAPVVINVGGPASAKINTMAGVLDDMNINTRALRQEVVHLPQPEGMFTDGVGMVVSDSDIACYMRPEKGGHILIGSEDPPCDDHTWVENDQAFNREFTDQWQTQAMRYAQRVPTVGIPSRLKGVVDLYDVSDDWIPIYDKSQLPGFYMACGSSGNQYKNAPIAGKLMAELVEYCENGNDQDTQPMQFNLPYLNTNFNSGFYSRRRVINKQSSFSVLG